MSTELRRVIKIVSVLVAHSSLLSLPAQAAATDIYISQAGGGNGSSCSNTQNVGFFNNSANWGTGASQIGPGTTVHLCGTFVGASNSTLLTFQGSGTSANRITLYFEPNAVLQSPYWSTTNGAISSNSQNYFTIDGGVNGIVRNTDNGTALGNQQDSIGIQVSKSNNYTVQNLSILDIYVRVAFTGGGTGFGSTGVSAGDGDNVLFTHNTVTNVKTGFGFSFTANHSNLEVSSNLFTGVEVPVILASVQANTTFTTFLLHDNDFAGGAYLWDDPVGNSFHHEALHMWAQAPAGNNHIVGTKVYNNYVHGIWGNDQAYYNQTGGTHITTLLYFEQTGGDVTVFNNVLDLSAGGVLNSTDNGMIFCKESAGELCYLYNNTLINKKGDTGFETAGGSGHILKNNIFYNVSYSIYLPAGGNNAVVADNNLYFGVVNWGASFDSWTGWRASGQDPHGLNGIDPKLNSDGTLQSGSPAIGVGANLTSLGITALDSDKAGTPRGSSWDIGAYQFGGTTPVCLNACDINCDGADNVADVQQEINMALGKATCSNPSGTCNVTSVQKVINAALGGPCVNP